MGKPLCALGHEATGRALAANTTCARPLLPAENTSTVTDGGGKAINSGDRGELGQFFLLQTPISEGGSHVKTLIYRCF